MIKVLLTGGLGNQLFQYAFGRMLSVKHNTSLVLSASFLQSKLPLKKLATPLRYELGVFNIDAVIESNFFTGKFLYPLAKTEHLIKEKISSIQLNKVLETEFSFQEELLNVPDNSFLKGNFQSEKYFKSIESVLRKELVFKNAFSGDNLLTKNKIEETNSVSIHVRRGDYLSIKKNAQKFAQIPISYYQDAIRHMAAKTKAPVFFVFSDDIDWVKDNLKTEASLVFVSNNKTPETSYMDMQLMSLCRHNIICNSTFSWWAAWLNNNPAKHVIAPQRWFSDVSINSQDIIPDEWIKL